MRALVAALNRIASALEQLVPALQQATREARRVETEPGATVASIEGRSLAPPGIESPSVAQFDASETRFRERCAEGFCSHCGCPLFQATCHCDHDIYGPDCFKRGRHEVLERVGR